MKQWSLFASKAKNSLSQKYKSMPWPVMLKLNGSTSWRPTRHSRTNIQKRCPFHYQGLECKSRKSRNTWSSRQIWPLGTKWSWPKVNRVLPREHTGHSKHPLITKRENSLHGHHQMVNTDIGLIIFTAAKYGEVLYSQQKQDWELTVAQIKNSLLSNSNLYWRK